MGDGIKNLRNTELDSKDDLDFNECFMKLATK